MTEPVPLAVPQSLALPPPWVERGFALRGETPDDGPFLERLFISVRLDRPDMAIWPPETRHSFLVSQFGFQTRHYANAYAGADYWIITHEQAPVGRLYLHHGPDAVRVIDISLLPEYRGGGLGTVLLQVLQAQGQPISLHVDMMNPAQTLYRRLGFAEAGLQGPSWAMLWRP